MRISHHCVEEHFSEWQLTSELEAQLYHPGNPEEQDVVSSFQERSRIKYFIIISLNGKENTITNQLPFWEEDSTLPL